MPWFMTCASDDPTDFYSSNIRAGIHTGFFQSLFNWVSQSYNRFFVKKHTSFSQKRCPK